MFRDDAANVVYITRALDRYPDVSSAMAKSLIDHGITVKRIEGTGNVWCRDYMPTQVDLNNFVKFNYKGYGDPEAVKSGLAYNDYPQLVVPDECWNFLPGLTVSPIILDVGNVSRRNGKAIITEIIFKHNPQYQPKRLLQKLEGLLEAEIVLIPVEPGDDLGHADGICKWIDDETVCINDTSVMQDPDYDEYTERLKLAFGIHGIECVPFAYAYNVRPTMTEEEFRAKYPEADDFNPGFGYYVNFLQVKDLILLPVFGIGQDDWALKCIAKYYPGVKCVPIDCADLSMEGGLVNCTSMNYME
jgi:agmatine deiminase